MNTHENHRAGSGTSQRILLVTLVSISMVLIVSLWLYIAPPLAPPSTQEGSDKEAAVELFNRTEEGISVLRSQSEDIKKAAQTISEAITKAASSTLHASSTSSTLEAIM